MMKKQIVAAVLAVSVAGGVGTGFAAHSWNDDKPSASPTDTPTVTTTPTTKPSTTPKTTAPATPAKTPVTALLPVKNIVIGFGSIGPVKVGMTKAEALATGYFNADAPNTTCDGPPIPLQWKSPYSKAFDIFTFRNGEVSTLGSWSKEARTATGLTVGSTYKQVADAYDDEMYRANDYGSAGILVNDLNDGTWIGFNFDAQEKDIKPTSKVTLIEVTKGREPGLLRDGC